MKFLSEPNLDKIGICTSTICAIHCLVTPILVILLPFAGWTFLEKETFEISLLVFSLLLAATSITVSYFKSHRNITPVVLAVIGFAFFVIGKIIHLEEVEIAFSIVGRTPGLFFHLAYCRHHVRISSKVVLLNCFIIISF